MINLSVLYTGHLGAPNGASKYVSFFEKYGSVFKERGIDFGGVFSLSGLGDIKRGESSQATRKTDVVRIISKSKLGTIFIVKRIWEMNANRVVKKYLDSKRNDDVIIFHDVFSYIKYRDTMKRKGMQPAKAIVLFHSSGEDDKMMIERFPLLERTHYWKNIKNRMNEALAQAKRFVFVSETSEALFRELHNSNKVKTTVMPCSIDNDRRVNADREYDCLKLVTVGSVCSRKNQFSIIKALEELDDKSVTLTICGGGPAYNECVEYVLSHDMKDRVFLHGQVRNRKNSATDKSKTVDDYLDESNAFIMASLDEGLPIAAIEAMKSGLALILTDVGGCKELIKGNGLLINPAVEDIKLAISVLNKDKRLLKKYGENSRNLFIQEHDVQILMEKYATLVHEVAEEK